MAGKAEDSGRRRRKLGSREPSPAPAVGEAQDVGTPAAVSERCQPESRGLLRSGKGDTYVPLGVDPHRGFPTSMSAVHTLSIRHTCPLIV